jgi:hypothetical protein
MNQPLLTIDAALSEWEGEGGSVFGASEPSDRGEACSPPLPPGYDAQQAWSFRDPTGAFSYEFCRVYEPAASGGNRGPFCQLDEGRSYWVVTWLAANPAGDHQVSRWISYAQARALSGGHLTFRRFASPMHMRQELPRLLHVAELRPAQDRISSSWSRAA